MEIKLTVNLKKKKKKKLYQIVNHAKLAVHYLMKIVNSWLLISSYRFQILKANGKKNTTRMMHGAMSIDSPRDIAEE